MRILALLVVLALALPASGQTIPVHDGTACPDQDTLQQKLKRHKEELGSLRPIRYQYPDVEQLRAEVEALEREIAACKSIKSVPPTRP